MILFWDIETYSSTFPQGFPSAERPEDHIFMISAHLEPPGRTLLYTTCHFRRQEPTEDFPDYELLAFHSEEEMLSSFLSFIRSLEGEVLMASYNGDSFDAPYLLARCQRYGILSPEDSCQIFFYAAAGARSSLIPALPGVRFLDMIHYFRRFGPALPNYKLDTAASHFLGRKKEDFSIADLMLAARFTSSQPCAHRACDKTLDHVHPEPNSLACQAAMYSVMDTLLLSRLWEAAAVSSRLEPLCRVLGGSFPPERVLRLPPAALAEALAAKLREGYDQTAKWSVFRHESCTPGLYFNVVEFDYTPLYARALESAGWGEMLRLLGERFLLEIYAVCLPASPLAELEAFFASLPPGVRLVSADLRLMRLSFPVGERASDNATAGDNVMASSALLQGLPVKDRASIFLCLAPCSSLRGRGEGEDFSLTFLGTSPLSRPPFPLARRYVEAALREELSLAPRLAAAATAEDYQALRAELKIRLGPVLAKIAYTWDDLVYKKAQDKSLRVRCLAGSEEKPDVLIPTEMDPKEAAGKWKPDLEYYRKEIKTVLNNLESYPRFVRAERVFCG